MRFRIIPPVGNTRSPINVETVLNSLHGLLRRKEEVELCVGSSKNGIGYVASIPGQHQTLFVSELQDVYPGTLVEHDNTATPRADHVTFRTELRLVPDVLSIRTFDHFVDAAENRQFADPMAGLLASVRTGKAGRVNLAIALTIRRASKRRIRHAEKVLRHARRRFRSERFRTWYLRLATSPSLTQRLAAVAILLTTSKLDNDTSDVSEKTHQNLFACQLIVSATVPKDAGQLAQNRLNEIAAAFGRFTDGDVAFQTVRSKRGKRSRRPFLLTARELATIWHPLTESGDSVSRVARPEFREVEPPMALSSNNRSGRETVLGRVKYRQERSQFGIGTDDLRRHMLAIGKTGCGKSTFLLNVIAQQIEANRGAILIDPHGQLAEEVLNVIPKRRTNNVVYFDASDRVAPVGFNPMIGPPGTDPTLVADGVLTSFKNVFGFDDGSAPRLLHIFRNCLLSLIGTPNASLAGVQRLLVDANFRKSVVAQTANEAVREFWLTEFNRWNDRDRTQYIASLQNKLGAFTTNERLQLILNADDKGLQLRSVMDSSGILICNLSKGTVGHDASTLIGSLLLSSIQIAAMSRADIPEVERRDCVVVVDEFHSYLTDGNSTMADALAESRKYRTSYVLSTQMLEQLDPATLSGVLGNCGSTLCMTVGPRDAEVLAELLGNGLTASDLMRIPNYHGYLRMLIDGAQHTFSMTTMAPPREKPNRAGVIRRVSQQRHGQ